jgi:voltage-dependent calcium channel alpha-2/delta-3
VIILIDASGSMTGLKKSIAIQTVETILDTLSDDDFVQIIKVNKFFFKPINIFFL